MPYITCPTCSTSTYSAARFSTVDECVRCGGALQGRRPTSAAWSVRGCDAPATPPSLRSDAACTRGRTP
jgi:hypothetical protein